MLSQKRFEILRMIHEREYMSTSEVRSKLGEDAFDLARTMMFTDKLLQHAYDHDDNTEGFVLSARGREELDEHQRRLDEEAEQRAHEEDQRHRQEQLEYERWRKDARRSWIQWAITTIIAVLSFFGGAITQFATNFVEVVISAIRTFFH